MDKGEDALRAIRDMLSARAMVVREGLQYTVPVEELVPGDCVLLQAGTGCRPTCACGLQIEEAALARRVGDVYARVIAVAVAVAVVAATLVYLYALHGALLRHPAGGCRHGVEIVLVGVGLFAVLELEKLWLRRTAGHRRRAGGG
ncbi:hypothetical protein [Halomonas stenophila]|uniref:Uncharacterized protein n=1 Tax=Halomonas stenophila TaxID=795312 RepID=A0A7W5HMF2_9GAMM|nr:hypothetical protein [Halomonas stenophila]MBB3232782.1 hypothetical protein [Halomonas stenophila]